MIKQRPHAFENIISTLILLESQSSIGRYALAELLNTSKAKARSILEEFNLRGITSTPGKSSGRSGNQLSQKGKELLNQLSKLYRIVWSSDHEFVYDPLLESQNQIQLILKEKIQITNGLYERDIAVRGGASGAITLIKSDENWIYPDSGDIAKNITIHDGLALTWICVFGETESHVLGGISRLLDYFFYEKITAILDNFGLFVQ